MQTACILLESGELTCAGIAERLGFSTPGNFTRAFRAAYAMTPSRFRANCRQAFQS